MSTLERTAMMCSFRAGTRLFGIDTREIREVLGSVRQLRVPLAPNYVDGLVMYRGEVLTTISLRALLGMERNAQPGCVLVLDDEENEERFGLAVDELGGVVMMTAAEIEPNPTTLDERSMDLFDGMCGTQSGLMVRLDPKRLRPSRLAGSKPFAGAPPAPTQEWL